MHKIIGVGTQDKPIKVGVDGRKTSASISWVVRTVEELDCTTNYVDTRYGIEVPLEPLECGEDNKVTNGTYSLVISETETITVYYQITQRKYECETTPTCETSCDVISTWTIPYYIDADYEGDIEFYCEYWSISEDCSREKKIYHQAITIEDLDTDITINGGCTVKPDCHIKTSEECTCYCEVINAWTEPQFISSDYEGDINFYCSYYLVSRTDGGVLCSREKKVYRDVIKKSDLDTDITIDSCGGDGCVIKPSCVIEQVTDCECTSITDVHIYDVTDADKPENYKPGDDYDSGNGGYSPAPPAPGGRWVCDEDSFSCDTRCNEWEIWVYQVYDEETDEWVTDTSVEPEVGNMIRYNSSRCEGCDQGGGDDPSGGGDDPSGGGDDPSGGGDDPPTGLKFVATYLSLPSRYNFLPNRTESGYCHGDSVLQETDFLSGDTEIFKNRVDEVIIKNCVTEIGDSCFYGTYFSSGYIRVGKSDDTSAMIRIPNTVTVIGNHAFQKGIIPNYHYDKQYGPDIISVDLPDSIETIGEQAFAGIPATSITLGNRVYTIGKRAFSDCTGITKIDVEGTGEGIHLPSNMTDDGPFDHYALGENMFQGCTSLTSITLPTGVTIINKYAFINCTGLRTLDLSNSRIRTILDGAFTGCTNLVSVMLPNVDNPEREDGFYRISSAAFSGCTSLTNITIPSTTIGIGNFAFVDCVSLTSIYVPEGGSLPGTNAFISIGESAFRGCTSLRTASFPTTLKRIYGGAFSGCTSLESITIKATTPPIFTDGYPFENSNNCPIYVPSGVNEEEGKTYVEIYKTANGWSRYADRIFPIS